MMTSSPAAARSQLLRITMIIRKILPVRSSCGQAPVPGRPPQRRMGKR